MATHFYDRASGLLTEGGGGKVPLTVTPDQIQVNDVIYYLSGNTIVAFSSQGQKKTVYPKPIPIPSQFLALFAPSKKLPPPGTRPPLRG